MVEFHFHPNITELITHQSSISVFIYMFVGQFNYMFQNKIKAATVHREKRPNTGQQLETFSISGTQYILNNTHRYPHASCAQRFQ